MGSIERLHLGLTVPDKSLLRGHGFPIPFLSCLSSSMRTTANSIYTSSSQPHTFTVLYSLIAYTLFTICTGEYSQQISSVAAFTDPFIPGSGAEDVRRGYHAIQ
jgi:hypothetical protein